MHCRATRLCASVLAAAGSTAGVGSPKHAFRATVRNAAPRRRFTFSSASHEARPPQTGAVGGDGASVGEFSRPLWQFVRFAGLLWAIDQFVVYLSMTQGPSMLPTLHERGDIVVVDRLTGALGVRSVARGDIVIADNPLTTGMRDRVCKRVVGVAGDIITPRAWGASVVVPSGHVWVEGDNGSNSVDSRYYGPVSTELLQGRVVARVWPPWKAAVLTGERRHGATSTAVVQSAGHAAHTDGALAHLPTPVASSAVGSLAGVAVMEGVPAGGNAAGVPTLRERPEGYGAGRGGGVPHWLHLPPRFVLPHAAPEDAAAASPAATAAVEEVEGSAAAEGDSLARALWIARSLTQ